MSEWKFAHAEKAECFAQLSHFSMTQKQGDREIEFVITVKEFAKDRKSACRERV